MRWFYAEGGRQIGPVEDASLDDLVRQGVVKDDTLVWREGMASWQPHGAVRGRPSAPIPAVEPPPAAMSAAAGAAAPAQPSETRYCSECGRPFPINELSGVGNASVCATCRPVVLQRMAAAPPGVGPVVQPFARYRYGGFWIRFVARIIDAIIVGFIGFIIRLPLTIFLGIGGAGLRVANDPAAAMAALPLILGAAGISFLIQIAVGIIYEVYFLSTRSATPGKIALGLKVIRADGGPVSAGLAAGRYFSMWLSGFILMIGYIMAGFDTEKRALHDRICDTRVVYAR